MDSCSHWLSTTAGGESWESLKDVVSTLGSVARLCGDKEVIIPTPKKPKEQVKMCNGPFSDESPWSSSDGDKKVKQLTAGERDAALQRELRRVCGPGYSNDLIEQFWCRTPVLESSNEDAETRLSNSRADTPRSGRSLRGSIDYSSSFSPSSLASSSDSIGYREGRVPEISNGRGDIGFRSKRPVAQKQSPRKNLSTSNKEKLNLPTGDTFDVLNNNTKKESNVKATKFRKCRNACVLNLLKKPENEGKQDLMHDSPVPDTFPLPDCESEPKEEVYLGFSTTDLNPDCTPFFPSYSEDMGIKAYVPSYMSSSIFIQNDEGFKLDPDNFPPLLKASPNKKN